jgi:hypothetical protein
MAARPMELTRQRRIAQGYERLEFGAAQPADIELGPVQWGRQRLFGTLKRFRLLIVRWSAKKETSLVVISRSSTRPKLTYIFTPVLAKPGLLQVTSTHVANRLPILLGQRRRDLLGEEAGGRPR